MWPFRSKKNDNPMAQTNAQPIGPLPDQALAYEMEYIDKYRLDWFEDIPGGCGGFKLTKPEKGQEILARTTYWDAMAQSYLEMMTPELPMVIIEWMTFISRQRTTFEEIAERKFTSQFGEFSFVKVGDA